MDPIPYVYSAVSAASNTLGSIPSTRNSERKIISSNFNSLIKYRKGILEI